MIDSLSKSPPSFLQLLEPRLIDAQISSLKPQENLLLPEGVQKTSQSCECKTAASTTPSLTEPCGICLVTMEAGAHALSSCCHIFHSECLRMHILVSMEEARFPILCPEKGCCQQILISDLWTLLSALQLDKFYHFSWKYYVSCNSDKMFGCPTPGCDNYEYREWYDYERKFCCGACMKNYCTECRLPWHLFMTCKEAQIESSFGKQDQEFQVLSKQEGFKRCPKCRTMLHRFHGCDHMTCRCGYEFCFTCLNAHKQHTHEEYLIAERRRKQEEKLKELMRLKHRDQGIKVVDSHTEWIYLQRLKIERDLKEKQKQEARPVPKYPAPPAAYLKSLKKIEEKKMMKVKSEKRHLLPARAGVQIL